MENKEQGIQILAKQPVNRLTTPILNALQVGDKVAMAVALRPYKLPNGATNYVEVLKIPHQDRIQGLISNIGFETTHRLMGAAITVAMEGLNLSKPLTPDQIIDLVDAIIDSSVEDQLALEDLILFLQKMVKGDYEDTNSRMDIPIFMRLFEKHRQPRYKTQKNYDYEQHVYYKSLGGGRPGGIELNRGEDARDVLGLMHTMYKKEDNEPLD